MHALWLCLAEGSHEGIQKRRCKISPHWCSSFIVFYLSGDSQAACDWSSEKTQTNSALLAWDAMHCAGQEKPMQEKVIRQTVGSDSSLLLLPPSPLLASVPPNTHQLLAFSSCFLFWSDWKNSWPFSSRPASRMSSTSVSSLPSTA